MAAARVLPSPVFISAILPSCNAMPPMTCTSKGRMPNVRLDASRTTAKASCRISSSPSPFPSRSRNSSDFARNSSSVSFSIPGSRAVTASTLFWSALTLRPSPMRRILANRLLATDSFLARPGKWERPSRLPCGLYEPVISVSTSVYHIYVAGIRAGEHEEVVVQKLHLQRGLLGAHGLHLELLGAHDARFYLLLEHNGLRGFFGGVPFALAVPAVELPPPVALDLPLELVRHEVYGRVHVAAGLAGLEHRAVDEQRRVGDLGGGDRGVAFVDQLHLRPRDAPFIVEEPRHALDLLPRVPLERPRHRNVAPLDRYVHVASLRSASFSRSVFRLLRSVPSPPSVDRLVFLYCPIFFEPPFLRLPDASQIVLHKVRACTSSAPARLRTPAHSLKVAPVVKTSSTRSTRPARLPRASKAPATFSRRSPADSSTCSLVLRTALILSDSGAPIRTATARAINSAWLNPLLARRARCSGTGNTALYRSPSTTVAIKGAMTFSTTRA